MSQVIECVPNVSEGSRPEVIAEFVEALSSVPGATLLDHTSDADHNRSVFTLVGGPAGVVEAVRRLYRVASERIDLREHSGGHPRIGAVDVVPLVPIRAATMTDCVALSRSVGKMIASEFHVPVFLYAESASIESRRLLSSIRKGEFEGIAAKMREPAWKADFGPTQPHPALGVSAVGARHFLIAFNLQLDTPNIEVADAIARAVRTSSGGLPHLQAIGVFLAERNQAQVSMNLLDYERTPLYRVQELVKIEAARYGARVVSSEIVGLVPQAALTNTAAYYLQVENWNPFMVLEEAMLSKE